MSNNILLECQNLKKYFETPYGSLHAVDDISFQLEEGKTLGVVGESGCGKSTLGRIILQLLKPTSGKVIFNGKEIQNLNVEHKHFVQICAAKFIFFMLWMLVVMIPYWNLIGVC